MTKCHFELNPLGVRCSQNRQFAGKFVQQLKLYTIDTCHICTSRAICPTIYQYRVSHASFRVFLASCEYLPNYQHQIPSPPSTPFLAKFTAKIRTLCGLAHRHQARGHSTMNSNAINHFRQHLIVRTECSNFRRKMCLDGLCAACICQVYTPNIGF